MLDIALIPVALVLALGLRLGEWFPAERIEKSIPLLVFLLVVAPLFGWFLSVHKTKLQSFGNSDSLKVGLFAACLGITGAAANWMFGLGAPRTVPVIFAFIFFVMASYFRLAAQRLLVWLGGRRFKATPVAVYGAGAAGLQLVFALRQSREIRPVVIVDDNPSLQGVAVSGISVQKPENLAQLVERGGVKRILLAMPSASKQRQQEIIRKYGHLCEIQALPSFIELMAGGGLVENLRSVSLDDLMDRDAVLLGAPEITNAYSNKSVFVSGAGGSIGSELCRQVLAANPEKIVLFEMSEIALYSIERELRSLSTGDIEILPILGSVCDQRLVDKTLRDCLVDTVLHAAAYKHVPLVEGNELEGVRNNVFGTKVLAEAAMAAGVKRFILVSSDKAVRPTNIMGATKRLAELVIQDLQTRSNATNFSMVRFGNVMGSSGSVIPLFREQIANGGPITVTHKDMTRFFMTIPEAARLVLLAGSFAEGGDVFVLDMGKQIKIIDMAKRLIKLSGLTVKDAENPEGNIEIVFTGIRPGEKLYEELLVGSNTLPTPHNKIMRAQEQFLSHEEVKEFLSGLTQAIDNSDATQARQLIAKWVEGYCLPVNSR